MMNTVGVAAIAAACRAALAVTFLCFAPLPAAAFPVCAHPDWSEVVYAHFTHLTRQDMPSHAEVAEIVAKPASWKVWADKQVVCAPDPCVCNVRP